MTGRGLAIVGILLWALLASQHAFYAVGLEATQRALGGPAYVELRQQIDLVLRWTLPAVYVATLAWTILLLVRGDFGRIALAVALAALLVELALTFTGNVPINELMHTWSAGAPPAEWQAQRDAWLEVFRWRQIVVGAGFVSFLIGVVR
jgi:hypothetical protein